VKSSNPASSDLIFENQSALSERLFGELTQRPDLDANALRESLRSGAFSERVARDFSGGVRSGVNGTPTVFINGVEYDASFEFEMLAAAISRKSQRHISEEDRPLNSGGFLL